MVVRGSMMNNNEIAVHQLLGLTNKILLNKSLLFSTTVRYYPFVPFIVIMLFACSFLLHVSVVFAS